jgi:F-type H+-transporting ATPase subunit gamma
VLSVGDGIMQVAGLFNARLYEMVELESGDEGIIFDIEGNGGTKRLLVAFGSSQGLCGAYNEKLADALSTLMKGDDSLYVVGRRLKTALIL